MVLKPRRLFEVDIDNQEGNPTENLMSDNG
jgi:hypothetical protein